MIDLLLLMRCKLSTRRPGFKRCLAASALLFAVLGGGCRHASDDDLDSQDANNKVLFRVFHFPIGASTLKAMTAESIERCTKPCIISSPRAASRLRSLLESGRQPWLPRYSDVFSGKLVRVKVIEPTDAGPRTFAIVEHKGAVRSSTEDRVLSPAALKELEDLIMAQCRPE